MKYRTLFASALLLGLVTVPTYTHAASRFVAESDGGVSGTADLERDLRTVDLQTSPSVDLNASTTVIKNEGRNPKEDPRDEMDSNKNDDENEDSFSISSDDFRTIHVGSATSTITATTTRELKHREDVHTETDLRDFAATVAQDNADIKNLEVSDTHVSAEHGIKGKLFGFIPMTAHVKTTLSADGSLNVDRPWYAFFMSDLDSAISALDATASELASTTPATNGSATSTAVRLQVRAHMIASLQAILDKLNALNVQ